MLSSACCGSFRSGPGLGTIYATALASSEIAPSVSPGVTRSNAGGNFQIEKQDIVFDATGGTFKLTFSQIGFSSLPNGQPSYYCRGTTPSISVSASAQEIQDEIIRINTETRPIALQVALLVPVLAGVLGLLNSLRMMRLPDIKPAANLEEFALG